MVPVPPAPSKKQLVSTAEALGAGEAIRRLKGLVVGTGSIGIAGRRCSTVDSDLLARGFRQHLEFEHCKRVRQNRMYVVRFELRYLLRAGLNCRRCLLI